MKKPCTLCGGSDSRVVFDEFGIDILKCRSCGHVFSSYEQEQSYDGYFGEREIPEEQLFWKEAHEKTFADFENRFLIGKGGKLLDAGCGLGFFVKRVSSFAAWEAFGCELSKPAVQFARQKLGLNSVTCSSVQDSPFPASYFDVVTMWDVIEHIPDPDPVLSHIASILKEDGTLFMHTPNVYIQLPKARITKLLTHGDPRRHYLEARDHINVYSMKTLTRVLHRNGFSKVDFAHFHPIQGFSGSRNRFSVLAKNALFQLSRVLFAVTFGRVNLDNLFAVARR